MLRTAHRLVSSSSRRHLVQGGVATGLCNLVERNRPVWTATTAIPTTIFISSQRTFITNKGPTKPVAEPKATQDLSHPKTPILLPNTDLKNFQDTPSLLYDTPYTTLPDLQRSASSIDATNDVTPTLAQLGADLYDPAIHLGATAPTDWSAYEAATPLWDEIAAWIGVAGRPISVADYMRLCNTHPAFGYYTQAGKKTTGSTAAAAAATTAVEDDFDVDEWDEPEHTVDDKTKKTVAEEDSDLIIGPGGDFVTAPEMSQIFGECLGIWCMTAWQFSTSTSTSISKWQWLEGGPGKGSLMADLIRFTFGVGKIRDSFGKGCQGIHFIEQSPRLREVQRKTLVKDVGHLVDFVYPQDKLTPKKDKTTKGKDDQTVSNKPTLPVYWHNTLASFQIWQKENDSYHATFAICQEFVDALPVYAFEKTDEGWRERLVDIALRDDIDLADYSDKAAAVAANAAKDPSSEQFKDKKKPRLRLVTAPEVTPAAKTLLKVDPDTGLMPNEDPPAPIGTVLEVNPEGILLAQELARIVDAQGGGALIIDYGQEGSRDSIRAFARHEQVHFLSRPGEVDVTADVDFAALRHGVNSLQLKHVHAFGPMGQGEFLMSMGAQERAIHLIESANTSDEDAENIYQALVRLCDPQEMGERFKVLAICSEKAAYTFPTNFSPRRNFHGQRREMSTMTKAAGQRRQMSTTTSDATGDVTPADVIYSTEGEDSIPTGALVKTQTEEPNPEGATDTDGAEGEEEKEHGRLATIVRMGFQSLSQIAVNIQNARQTQKSMFAPAVEEVEPWQKSEEHKIFVVANEVLDSLPSDSPCHIMGQPIEILKVDLRDRKLAILYWALPLSIIHDETISNRDKQIIEFRMHNKLVKEGGAKLLQWKVHAALSHYYPPRLRLDPAPHGLLLKLLEETSF